MQSSFAQSTAKLKERVAARSLAGKLCGDFEDSRMYHDSKAGCKAAERCKVFRGSLDERAERGETAPASYGDVLVGD